MGILDKDFSNNAINTVDISLDVAYARRPHSYIYSDGYAMCLSMKQRYDWLYEHSALPKHKFCHVNLAALYEVLQRDMRGVQVPVRGRIAEQIAHHGGIPLYSSGVQNAIALYDDEPAPDILIDTYMPINTRYRLRYICDEDRFTHHEDVLASGGISNDIVSEIRSEEISIHLQGGIIGVQWAAPDPMDPGDPRDPTDPNPMSASKNWKPVVSYPAIPSKLNLLLKNVDDIPEYISWMEDGRRVWCVPVDDVYIIGKIPECLKGLSYVHSIPETYMIR